MVEEKVHLRHIMLYEFRKSSSVGTTHKNMMSVYFDRAPALRTIKKWFARFRQGKFSLEDEPRSGRHSDIDEDVLRTLVETCPGITTEEIAGKLKIDHSTAFRRLKKLGFIAKLDTWLPHSLTERNKLDRMNLVLSLQTRNDREPFLDRLVTGNEKYILCNNVTGKRKWKDEETADSVRKPMKILLCVWWDCRGIIRSELLNKETTAEVYCQQLARLDEALREKRPDLVNKGVIFHQDDAMSHMATQTRQKLQELKWEVLPHPPYSPDIAPSDFYLFPSIQSSLNDKQIDTEEEVEKHLKEFFDDKPTTFYKNGIEELVSRWITILENNGDYIMD